MSWRVENDIAANAAEAAGQLVHAMTNAPWREANVTLLQIEQDHLP